MTLRQLVPEIVLISVVAGSSACIDSSTIKDGIEDTSLAVDTALQDSGDAVADTGSEPDTGVTSQYITRAGFWNAVLPDAGYELIPCEGQRFPDVPTDHPYCPAVNTAFTYGFDLGDESGLFHPDKNLNRAESSKLISLPYPIPPSTSTESSFKDVDPNSWYHPYVEGLNEAGAFRQSSGPFYPESSLEEDDLEYWISQLPPTE